MFNPSPLQCADRQLARDRAATAAFPAMLGRKLLRMTVSPLGYLRGAAALFYELLTEHPELSAGPDGEGWLVGDAHLENFGAFRSEDGRGSEAVVFDVNDFDEAIVAPFRWDVVRLLTSVILGGREIGSDGMQSVRLCSAILQGYVPALCEGRTARDVPQPVRRLLEKVDRRTHKDLLDRRTERTATGRRFVRGDRYQDLAPELVGKAHAAFTRYVERLDPAHAQDRDHFVVEDVAFRIAGTGSLGVLRIAVLTRGKGEPDSRWIFDMKAQGVPAGQALLSASATPTAALPALPVLSPAERVMHATRACLAHPPRMLGTTELDESSLFVRRLLPQEDKLDLSRLQAEELPELARHLGALLGSAHRRGAVRTPSASWTAAEQALLTEHAIVIAGLHEAAYLALCKATAP
ncbi:MAG TPA: DUF2252 family protein [Polyangiaceae bacterium]|nr:DUF2252 family protein [Polyangiaceae bacterium]